MNRFQKKIAERVSRIQPSATVALPDRARALRAQGLAVIDLAEGEPYFDTPGKIKIAAKQALDEGHVHYVSSRGIVELRQAIVDKLRVDNEVEANENEIIVTVGAKQALFTAMLSVVNPGDEVLIPEPFWVSYLAEVLLPGGRPVPIKLLEEEDFRLDEEELKRRISEKTKVILINSPHNPTGTVFPKEDLRMVADLAQDHDLLVVADEIYEKILYDGQHHSIAALPEMKERTILINGFSKAYSMTGWRLGYVVASSQLIESMLKIQQHSVTHPSSFVQKAGVVALRECEEEVHAMVCEYKERRDYFIQELNRMRIFSCRMPRGAFYAFPKLVDSKLSAEELAEYLLSKAHVLTVPGSAFGQSGRNHLRIVYSRSKAELEDAVQKIGIAVNSL